MPMAQSKKVKFKTFSEDTSVVSSIFCHFDLKEKSAEIQRFFIFVPQIQNDSFIQFMLDKALASS